jgi:hypothetical protein
MRFGRSHNPKLAGSNPAPATPEAPAHAGVRLSGRRDRLAACINRASICGPRRAVSRAALDLTPFASTGPRVRMRSGPDLVWARLRAIFPRSKRANAKGNERSTQASRPVSMDSGTPLHGDEPIESRSADVLGRGDFADLLHAPEELALR